MFVIANFNEHSLFRADGQYVFVDLSLWSICAVAFAHAALTTAACCNLNSKHCKA